MNAAVKEAMAALQKALAAGPDAVKEKVEGRKGSELLSSKLPPKAKETMDRVTAEWVIDADQAFNAASTAPFRRMMSTSTNGMYDGACDKTVKHHIAAMDVEGKQECKDFHEAVAADGTKPVASGDLWSKNGTALFGVVSHGIRRKEVLLPCGVKTIKWEMNEKLAGAVPCNDQRHTPGEHIAELSHATWRETGITEPVTQLFARISDNGSNMMKGCNEGFQLPCADHTPELSVNLFTKHPLIAPDVRERSRSGRVL